MKRSGPVGNAAGKKPKTPSGEKEERRHQEDQPSTKTTISRNAGTTGRRAGNAAPEGPSREGEQTVRPGQDAEAVPEERRRRKGDRGR